MAGIRCKVTHAAPVSAMVKARDLELNETNLPGEPGKWSGGLIAVIIWASQC